MFSSMLISTPKVLFFGQDVERSSLCQYAIISLFPSAIKCLYDSLSYEYAQSSDNEDSHSPVNYTNTTDKHSDDRGLPLQLFHKVGYLIFKPIFIITRPGLYPSVVYLDITLSALPPLAESVLNFARILLLHSRIK